MKKIVTIIGARPQLIKTALLSRELQKYFQEVIVHTGQHYDLNMSDIFYQDLNLPEVDYNLEVGSASQGKQTAMMMERIEEVLLEEKPDMVLVYGDTNSTMAGALVATKLHIPVGHVESGMRSFNRRMPEEINRVVTDHVSDLLFCSTKSVVENLKEEGIKQNVHFVGDVMFDLQESVVAQGKVNSILEKLDLKPQEYILATIHRQENTDIKENLVNILEAFGQSEEIIIWPIHPRTKKCLEDYKLIDMINKIDNLEIIDPISYTENIELEKNAKLILTDSGGVQKEAYVAKVPCITLREETEWTETVESGWNQLAGADTQKIVRLIRNYPEPKDYPKFLGDGDAYLKITKIIQDFLKV
ncbi:MAG: UDP-N-acetylglucosamine 2-epimerase (non-hydrolyzing) [Candidatus Berkelbacteria bacterium]